MRGSGKIGVSVHVVSRRLLLISRGYVVNIAHKLDPSVPAGAPDSYKPEEAVHLFQYDASKEKRIFGINLIEKEECVRDMLVAFKEKGWWPKKN